MAVTTERGPAGRLAQRFQDTKLTPLLALAAALLGVFAIMITPREEEPQIDVTFANIFIPFPGASALEVENLVATPMEQIVSEIKGVKHTYSVSRPGLAIVTVQYMVGEPRTQALVRLYNAVFSHQDWHEPNTGIGPPLIKPKGIDDVPILALTLSTPDASRGADELQRVAHAIEAELKRVPGTRDVYTLGGPDRIVHVELDPQRLAAYGLSLDAVSGSLMAANVVSDRGVMTTGNRRIPVTTGAFLNSADDIAELIVGVRDGKPVFMDDIAVVTAGPDYPERMVWSGVPDDGSGTARMQPAVTVAIAKKSGANAVRIAARIIDRIAAMRGTFIPDEVQVSVTRNYGRTADDKAHQLIHKLFFATGSVVLLVLVTLGWRAAAVVGLAVAVTLLLTLFASWAWGFTINRVSLFALIFSIGILVDDAIVVVENVHRHIAMGDRHILEAVPDAVDEVGNPTILATLTVIAALLPMAFVTGLMGPYMSPIPINASTGMLISLAVAMIFTPWLCHRFLAHTKADSGTAASGPFLRAFTWLLMPLLGANGRRRHLLMAVVLLLIGGSLALVGTRVVILKMLPFDNKSEFQVVLDMDEGTTVEQTSRVLSEMGRVIEQVPEVANYQIYAGLAAPINFNGLVRQYYLRREAHLGDIQVNLVDKHSRKRQSHEIVRALRPLLERVAANYAARVKVVEVPPGPPVMAPLVAEIYGPDYAGQRRLATSLAQRFRATRDVVDVDNSVEAAATRTILRIDRAKAGLLGVTQASIARAVRTALHGEDVTFVHSGYEKYPVPVRLELSLAAQAEFDQLLMLRVPGAGGSLVPLSELVSVEHGSWQRAIYHKDLLPVSYVVGDMAGDIDSPLYAMAEIATRLAKEELDGTRVQQYWIAQPPDPYGYAVKWDGEWQITYETFRDMAVAYAAGLILIYLLVVGQFRSYVAPLIIMAPIPLTIIGVLPGHAMLGAKFTATSMIGMIALAGIIVRNSILLVDFINHALRQGLTLEDAVVHSAAVRAKPILLTALAAMIGATFILDDPIFNGLAVALIFGIMISTLLTMIIIPVLYYLYARTRLGELAATPR